MWSFRFGIIRNVLGSLIELFLKNLYCVCMQEVVHSIFPGTLTHFLVTFCFFKSHDIYFCSKLLVDFLKWYSLTCLYYG